MPKSDRDPIQAVKAFLSSENPEQSQTPAPGRIAEELREIRERLERARKVERRVSLSKGLEILFAGLR